MNGVTINRKAFQEQVMKAQGYNLLRFRKRSMSYRTMQDVRNLYGTTSQPLTLDRGSYVKLMRTSIWYLVNLNNLSQTPGYLVRVTVLSN